MSRFRQLLPVAILSLTLARASAAAAPAASPPPPRKITTVEGITEYQLANGLRVLLYPDQSKPTVTINITYLVGSRHEGAGEAGMAHLLEHMLFKGSDRHKPWKELQDHGAFFNGTTSYDRTNYFETLPATPENLKFAIDLEADRMVSSHVAADDLASEFSVVRNEFEIGENNPFAVLFQRMFQAAYIWHSYGRPTIGSRSDIEHVPIENLRAFYRNYYQPDNAMLVVAGKFEPAETLNLIQQHFGRLPRPTRKIAPTWTVEPQQDGERSVMLRRTGDVAMVSAMYHGLSGPDADFAAEEALVDLLTNEPSGRLYKALVEKHLAASVQGVALQLAEPGTIGFFAFLPKNQTPDVVRDKLVEIVEGVARGKVSDDEVARWRARWLKYFELEMADSGRIGVTLTGWAAMGDWRLLFLHRDRVKKVTPADVQRVAAEFLKQANRTVGVFLPTKSPERAPLPPLPDVATMVQDYKGADAVAEGEQFDATLESVERRTRRATLPSGMKLAFLPRKTRANAVHAVLNLHFAREADLKGKTTAATLIPPMLMRGTRKHTYQQIKDELDQLKAEVRFTGNEGTTTAHITTVRDNLPRVLSLVSECLREATFPKTEFEIVRKERITELESQLQEPQALGFNAIFRKLAPWPKGDVRYRPTLVEQVEQLKAVPLTDVIALHHNFFGTSRAEVAIVGDFDDKAIEAQLAKELGSWKSPRPFERIAYAFKATQTGTEVIETPDKQNAMVGAAYSLAMRDDDPDYPAMMLINHLLGGAPKSRVFERLRQKEGLSYGAGTHMVADSFDKNGWLLAFAFCASANADKVVAALNEELEKLVARGVPDDELASAKLTYKALYDNRLSNNEFVMELLSRNLYVGRTSEYQKKLLDRIAALTPTDVAAAIKKYVQPEALTWVKAGDLHAKRTANK